MGCMNQKESRSAVFHDHDPPHKSENSIRIQRITPQSKHHIEDEQDKQIHLILSPVQAPITDRKPDFIIKDIVQLSEECIFYYNEHDIDTACKILHEIQTDLKELEKRGFEIEMNKHFKHEFIQLSQKLNKEYEDMVAFNEQITKGGWKLKKEKKNFKISSRIDGDTVGIMLESLLQVPFENFIAVLIQPDHYKHFLPFLKQSSQQKNVARNCKIGRVQMQFPLITNRQSFFQGVLYNRLNQQSVKNQQLFMYTRTVHDRPDLLKVLNYEVKINPKCIQFDYKYLVVKYVPIGQNSGRMVMGMNIDLKLNMIPLGLLEMVCVNFCEQFYNGIINKSQKFGGSIWQKGLQKNSQLFDYTKRVKNAYLSKKKPTPQTIPTDLLQF